MTLYWMLAENGSWHSNDRGSGLAESRCLWGKRQ